MAFGPSPILMNRGLTVVPSHSLVLNGWTLTPTSNKSIKQLFIYLFMYLSANQKEHSNVRWCERNERSMQL